MPGNDPDFAAYLAARWPFLVRSLVLIGCPRPDADQVAEDALARCYSAWDRVRKADDVDVHVYRAMLASWRRSRRRRPGRRTPERPPEPDPDPLEEVTDDVLLRRALEEQLAVLAPEHREALVLRFVAGLTDVQVADVLDVPVGTAESRVARAIAQLDVTALREVAG